MQGSKKTRRYVLKTIEEEQLQSEKFIQTVKIGKLKKTPLTDKKISEFESEDYSSKLFEIMRRDVLSQMQAEVVRLKQFEGQTNETIASILNISVKQVHKCFTKACKNIKKYMNTIYGKKV